MFRKKKELKALKGQANWQLSQGNAEKAKIYYVKGLEIDPTDTDMMIQLGAIYFGEEKWDLCERLLAKANELKPEDDIILQNIGALYIRKEKWEKALHYLNEAVHINPHNAYAWNNIGLVQQERHRLDEAEACFTKAIENDPGDLEYVFNLGDNYEKKRNYGEALKIFTLLLANEGSEENDETNHELLRSKITHLTDMINTERLSQLKKTLQVSTKLSMNRLQDSLQMADQEFNRKIVDWAHEFGFTIEGEYVIVNQSTVSDFLESLDNQFSEWSQSTRSKESKI